MVLTPCALALFSMAAPDSESRLTIARTVTPSVSIWSAMVCIRDASPWAFWIVASTPAALKAFSSCGRSALSQRADDLVSGRITPTLPLLAASPPPVAVPPPLLPPVLLSPPQAVSASVMPTTPANATDRLRPTTDRLLEASEGAETSKTASWLPRQLLCATTYGADHASSSCPPQQMVTTW